MSEISREFPYVKSSSYLSLKLDQHLGDKRFFATNNRLMLLIPLYDRLVVNLRKSYKKSAFKLDNMKFWMGEYKAGNCGEFSMLAFDNLAKMKLKPKRVSFYFYSRETGAYLSESDHVFTVFGQSPKSKLKNPKTWGNKAVIVDPWLKISGESKQMINYMLEQFGYDPKKHFVMFSNETTISQYLTSLISRLK